MVHPFITDAQATQKIQESYNEIVNSIGTGFQGTVKIADTPTEEGVYIPTESGTYPNAGNLEYDPEGEDEGYLVMFIYDGDWTKSKINVSNEFTADEVLGIIRLNNIEQGSIDSETGEEKPLSSRVRTSDFIYIEGGMSILNLPENITYVIAVYSDNNTGSFLYATKFTAEEYINKDLKDVWVKVVFREIRFDDTTMDPELVKDVILVDFKSEYSNSIINKKENPTIDYLFGIKEYELEPNSILAEDGQPSENTNSRRVRFSDFVDVNGLAVVNNNDDIIYRLHYYSDTEEFIKTTDAIDSTLYVDRNFKGKIKMSIARSDNDRIDFGEVTKLNVYSINDSPFVSKPSEIPLESGTLNSEDISHPTGEERDHVKRRRTKFIEIEKGYVVSVNPEYELFVFNYDEDFQYIERVPNDWAQSYINEDFSGNIRVVVRSKDNSIFEEDFDDSLIGLQVISLYDYKDILAIVKNYSNPYNNSDTSNNNLINPHLHFTAHRGLHFGEDIPENTEHSVRMAKRYGYTTIETDVKRTSDGYYIIMHDNTINRTMEMDDGSDIPSTVNVSSTTLENIKSLARFKSNNPRYRTKALTVEEFMKVCKLESITPMLDIKINYWDYLDDVVEIMGDDWICFSTRIDVLRYARSISNCLCLYNTTETDINEIISVLESIGGWCGISSRNMSTLTESNIKELRKRNYEVQASIPTTSNSVRLMSRGITMLLTDEHLDLQGNSINLLENIYSDGDYTVFNPTGSTENQVLVLSDGEEFSFDYGEELKYGCIDLTITFKGQLNVTLNGTPYAAAEVLSDNYETRRLSLRLMNDIPSFNAASVGNSEVIDVNLRIAEF